MNGIQEICTFRAWKNGSITEILLENIQSLATKDFIPMFTAPKFDPKDMGEII